jgi:DNA helicase IV
MSEQYTKKDFLSRERFDEAEALRLKEEVSKILNKAKQRFQDPEEFLLDYYHSDNFHSAVRESFERDGHEGIDEKIALLTEDSEARFERSTGAAPVLSQSDVVLLAIILLYIDREKLGREYDHIVVDEAQDISAPLFFLLYNLLKKENKSMTIVGDAGQTLYGDGLSSWTDFGFEVSSYELKLSHRCPYHIMRFAACIINKEVASLDVSTAEKVVKIGHKPVIKQLASEDDECAYVANKIAHLRKEEPKASIAVVASQPKFLYKVGRALDDNSVAYHVAKGSDFVFGPTVILTNMHQVKGLEFDYVFIIHLGRLYEADWMKQKDFLLYVSATRALEKLYITYTGDAPKVFERIPTDLFVSD